MTFTRKNVWNLGGDWADTILWYARGVKAMKSRALGDRTSWRFFGGVHGFDAQLWQQLGYFSLADAMPGDDDVATYWNQCQHGSWYFLPWHRGYLIAFEAVLRDAVVKLGGPADWALPYWNYFGPGQNTLPPAFASANWPDGSGDNPLYVPQRYGPRNDGNVSIPLRQLNLRALGDKDFSGGTRGGGPGFGGVDTGFSHGGQIHGAVESQPHDMVHVLVGGSDGDTRMPGLMSVPDTAGLDPIFWLHHANVDRLWEVWRRNPPTNMNPDDANWLNGAAALGDRAFVMPMPGAASWTYTPAQVSDLSKLDYAYDDVSSPAQAPRAGARIQRLVPNLAAGRTLAGGTPMAHNKTVELLGASKQRISVAGVAAHASVALDAAVRNRLTASLRQVQATPASEPDRVFLNLENVRGLHDAIAVNVYINLPDGADPEQHPELLAGSVGLFGVSKASAPDGQHAGNGLTLVIEISDVIDTLHLANRLDAAHLDVRLVPVNPVPDAAQLSIGRISVFRQSAS